jgi:uncharacterized membrane protein YgaE (UPF0421/DUF939 family)
MWFCADECCYLFFFSILAFLNNLSVVFSESDSVNFTVGTLLCVPKLMPLFLGIGACVNAEITAKVMVAIAIDLFFVNNMIVMSYVY